MSRKIICILIENFHEGENDKYELYTAERECTEIIMS